MPTKMGSAAETLVKYSLHPTLERTLQRCPPTLLNPSPPPKTVLLGPLSRVLDGAHCARQLGTCTSATRSRAGRGGGGAWFWVLVPENRAYGAGKG
jgi:hypothetical protein